jgi:hypothetical protein
MKPGDFVLWTTLCREGVFLGDRSYLRFSLSYSDLEGVHGRMVSRRSIDYVGQALSNAYRLPSGPAGSGFVGLAYARSWVFE